MGAEPRFCRVKRGQQMLTMGEECVPNIGARGRRRRLWLGARWLVATALLIAELLIRNAAAPAFLLVAPFAMICSLYYFQVKEKT